MRHGDALGAAVALVGDETVDALCLRYDETGVQTSHIVERLTFAELVRRAAASEGWRAPPARLEAPTLRMLVMLPPVATIRSLLLIPLLLIPQMLIPQMLIPQMLPPP